MNKERVEKLIEYAHKPGHKFVWIYRGEGCRDPRLATNSMSPKFTGTWFTEYFGKAKDYAEASLENGSVESQIIACVVTQEMLDHRSDMQKGMGEINITFREEIEPKIVSEPVEEAPQAEDYLNQFVDYREYMKETRAEISDEKLG